MAGSILCSSFSHEETEAQNGEETCLSLMSHLLIHVRRFQMTEKWENTILALLNIDTGKVDRTIREKEMEVMGVFPEEASLELGLQVCVGVCHGE